MRSSIAGRWAYAVGINERAARVARIPIGRVVLGSYVFSGLMAGLTAILLTARLGSASANMGNDGMVLDIVSACVVGGVSIYGGSGRVPGALFGALLITVLSNAMNLIGVSFYLSLVIKGAVIIAFVAARQTQRGPANDRRKRLCEWMASPSRSVRIPAITRATWRLAAVRPSALMGANGAGKSTLMNILGGVVASDRGRIFHRRCETSLCVRRGDATHHGIAFVHQELTMFPTMSVAENIFIDEMPSSGWFIRSAEMMRQAEVLLARLGCEISPATPVEQLSIGDRQLVEIARALRHRATDRDLRRADIVADGARA